VTALVLAGNAPDFRTEVPKRREFVLVATQLSGATGRIVGGVEGQHDRATAVFREGEVTRDGFAVLDDDSGEGEVRSELSKIGLCHSRDATPRNREFPGRCLR
jgi:hypothetical protein